jgi:hypothetical protein
MENSTDPNNIQPEAPIPQATITAVPEASIPQAPLTPFPEPSMTPVPQVPLTPIPEHWVPPVAQPQVIRPPVLPPQQILNVQDKGKFSTSTIVLSIISGILVVGFIFLFVKVGNLSAQLENANVASKITELEKQSSSLWADIEKIKEVQEPFLKYFDEVKSYTVDSYDRNGYPKTTTPVTYKSNDEQRVANLNTAATAIGAYYSDREQYPEMNEDWCFWNIVKFTDAKSYTNYFPKWYPKDPQTDHLNEGCSTPWEYAYKSIKDAQWYNSIYAMSATMEDPKYGNSAKPLSEYSDSELSSSQILRNEVVSTTLLQTNWNKLKILNFNVRFI